MKYVIKTDLIKDAVFNLCVQANTIYSQDLYNKIYEEYIKCADADKKQKLYNILVNIQIAYSSKRPLCQDTGQVLIFIEAGKNICFDGDVKNAVNDAVSKAYLENYFRKSVVFNSLFDRTNTKTNTPAIIYTDFADGDDLTIMLLVKGAGSENYSSVKMFEPTAPKENIYEFIKSELERAGEKACPPYVLGIGAGGTMDYSAVLSKKAFFSDICTPDEEDFLNGLKEYLNKNGLNGNVLDIKLKTASTHIACLPVSLTINCHSTRHAQCVINSNGVVYNQNPLALKQLPETSCQLKEINTSDIDKIKSLKSGENVLLSGEIYTARDAAHFEISKHFERYGEFPFDLKGKIIFYAGPCPSAPNEVIGPVGPTTSARMDRFAEFMYGYGGIVASIGKGERSDEAVTAIKKYNGKYFTVQGGVACLLSKCVVSSEVIAFDELGTEAVRKLTVEKLPVHVEF